MTALGVPGTINRASAITANPSIQRFFINVPLKKMWFLVFLEYPVICKTSVYPSLEYRVLECCSEFREPVSTPTCRSAG